jgi:hypothetical protein
MVLFLLLTVLLVAWATGHLDGLLPPPVRSGTILHAPFAS